MIDWHYVIDISILAVALYFAIFKTYANEKVKNLATKEDIEEITKRVESVKSEVQILTHRKTTFEDEKKETLLKFYSTFHLWLDSIVFSSPDNTDTKNYDYKSLTQISKFYTECSMAQANVMIYYYDDLDLIILIGVIVKNTLDMEFTLKNTAQEIEMYNIGIKNASNEPYASKDNEMKILANKYDKLKEYHIKVSEKHAQVSNLMTNLVKEINKRIKY
jgi:hypothetical protein